MRKLLYPAISVVAAAAFAAPALAHSPRHHVYRHAAHHERTRAIVHPGYRDYAYAPPAWRHNGARTAAPIAGVAAGTTVGVGVAEGWGTAAATAALPATTAGAAAVGGAAGMGAVAAVDAMLEPCRGFAAVFDLSQGECQGGHYVGSPENDLTPWNRQRR